MSPEAKQYLRKAEVVLMEADAMIAIDLFEPAARTAYLAAFHAAQALISDRLKKSVKTHKGVQMLFHDITRTDDDLPFEIRTFLSVGYDMKMVADYEVEPERSLSQAQAEAAVALAPRFVAHFTQVLGS